MTSYYSESFPVGSFQCNCTILVNRSTQRALIVDPGDDFPVILDRVHALGVSVWGLWHSHAHIDHIGATKALFETLNVENMERGLAPLKVFLHPEDKWLYENVAIQAKMLGLYPFEIVPQFENIVDRQNYEPFPNTKAIHTPGHTPGSACLLIKDTVDVEGPRGFISPVASDLKNPPQILLSGDTLFRQSIGRTDLWGGDGALIIKSIREKLLSLNAATVVIPGHGPFTTIAFEKEKNPFL